MEYPRIMTVKRFNTTVAQDNYRRAMQHWHDSIKNNHYEVNCPVESWFTFDKNYGVVLCNAPDSYLWFKNKKIALQYLNNKKG